MANPHCRRLEVQLTRLAFSFALARAGSNRAARIAMIAMTTNNSIRVKAPRLNLGAFTLHLSIAILIFVLNWRTLCQSAASWGTYHVKLARHRVGIHICAGTRIVRQAEGLAPWSEQVRGT